MNENAPLAAVTLTFREASSVLRARVSDALDPSILDGLWRQGVTGLVEVHTCARSLWLLSSSHPAWAGGLLQASMGRKLQGAGMPMLKVGEDAFRHLLRVSVGLESFVQGEADIGGQVTRGFEAARAANHLDGVLNLSYRSVNSLLTEGREAGFIRPNRGVGQLAVDTLIRLGADRSRPVGVVGHGSIGQRVVAALHRAEWASPVIYNRSPKPHTQPLSAIATAGHEALVLCTAGPEGWFVPPDDVRHIVDIGVPRQCAPTSVNAVDLDGLLNGDAQRLSPERIKRAEHAVARELEVLIGRIRTARWQRSLSRLNSVRDEFMEGSLEPLLADRLQGLSPEQRKQVLDATRSVLRHYSHTLLMRLKEELPDMEVG